MFTKICGVSNAVDAEAVNASEASAIGFVMGGRVLPVEIEPSAQLVRTLIRRLRSSLLSVLVTHCTEVEEILALSAYIGCGAIQVSEPVSAKFLAELRRRSDCLMIKTVIVEPGADRYLAQVETHCDYLLLDSCVAGYVGGTGVCSDWKVCRELAALARRPVLLAGGLTPDLVSSAVATVRPAGLDVSTGVSCFSSQYPRKDRKDPERIKRFVENASRAGMSI